MERIEKETLNIEKCRAELRRNQEKGVVAIFLCGLLQVPLFGLIHILLAIAFSFDLPVWAVLLLWLLPALFFVVAVILAIRELAWIEKAPFILVEDTLSGSNEIATERKSHRPPHTYITYHWEFYFAEHGRYGTTGEIAPWSVHHMSAKDLLRCSERGDKFYLLLDGQVKKEQTPQILRIYPCRFFTRQGESL